jgi:hypothetical protein
VSPQFSTMYWAHASGKGGEVLAHALVTVRPARAVLWLPLLR